MRTLAILLLFTLPALADKDSDGDGISDFRETHKHFTDPNKRDSDGDGIPDGDWNERREYAYTIRTIIQCMPPYNTAELTDDYQDARILERSAHYIELEVIHYPLNTVHRALKGRRDWRAQPAKMAPYLAPGVTTNWDAAMQADMLAGLKKDGIDLDALTDVQAARKVAAWLMKRAKYINTFTTYKVHFPGGRPTILPGQEASFRHKKFKPEWSVQDQFEHELLGRGMYRNRTRGSCTSSAVYLTTGLRAAGIPTRMVIAIPAVDGSNPAQVEQLERRITHHQVRATVMKGVRPLKQSFAAHTFNEVHVAGRWHRLNYTKLGQNILDAHYFGLLTHVHTFNDLSEANLAKTWGNRRPDRVFRFSNPYSTPVVSDRFGRHAMIPNPSPEQLAKKTRLLTVTKAYWFLGPDRPAGIAATSVEQDGSGHVLIHVRESNFGRNMAAWQAADKRFVLRAKGKPELVAMAERGCWGQEFYLRISKGEMRKMARGVRYTLHAVDTKSPARWKIIEGVGLTRK